MHFPHSHPHSLSSYLLREWQSLHHTEGADLTAKQLMAAHERFIEKKDGNTSRKRASKRGK